MLSSVVIEIPLLFSFTFFTQLIIASLRITFVFNRYHTCSPFDKQAYLNISATKSYDVNTDKNFIC